ncbi:hypothetical protein BU23DRAFT_562623 [Bimuria novae-zelandiae CBS 107.79]|uniref:Uncharacterized protein n=1 Tax=Bimuria novae-zelandiae CBS 107.79 TaxID=1447943 RepID=A0A6A5W433_9PLEO|nr:hypothetical protein BU23DRAFT_562623 [Bimuria novae-zelandiae CBS 107.79]
MLVQEKIERLEERAEERQRRKDEREERAERRREAREDEEDRRRNERVQSYPCYANYAQLPRMPHDTAIPPMYAQPLPVIPAAASIPAAPVPAAGPQPPRPPPVQPQHHLRASPVNPLSSPINTAKDEYDMSNNIRRLEWQSVKEQATANYWTMDDLKGMAQPSSELYRLATKEYHIPDGIARGFRKFMSQYKPIYRQNKDAQAAGLLVDMQLGGGGFVRGGEMA